MPSRRVLRSVARSFSDSFTSNMNWREGDYILGHILNAARRSGKNTLTVDILSGQASPDELVPVPVRASIADYCARFPRLVTTSGADTGFVAEARMVLTFDITIVRDLYRNSRFAESPYVCTTTIKDDRGKVHEGVNRGWWYPET